MSEPPGARPVPASVPPDPPRNHVGTISLAVAIAGAAASHLALARGGFGGAVWLELVASGFEAAVVGALADWFAVTALFRHPLNLPIPHTRIIPKNRRRIIEGIVATVEGQWLSPRVIRARLERLTPSEIVRDWIGDPSHVERIAAPLRDLLGGLARLLDEPELVAFGERAVVGGLREIPLGATAGRWLGRAADSEEMGEALRSVALSLVKLAERERTAEELHLWLLRAARTLRESGRVVVPFLLRRRSVQRTIVDAALRYASSELRDAAEDPTHPLRRYAVDGLRNCAVRLEKEDPAAIAELERVRAALAESIEAGPALGTVLGSLRRQIEADLADPRSPLSELLARQIREQVPAIFDDAERRERFDRWFRDTAIDLVERHHAEIGRTVRENLEALDDDTLVAQIEGKVGADLQYIRLNGALVGGLIGVGLAALRFAFA